jgi:hypothetical protein
LPALDEALELLRAKSPLSIEEASVLLKTSGISLEPFHPASVIAAAEACGRKPPIRFQTIRNKTIVATAEITDADVIMRTAYRQAHASGASNVAELRAELHSKGISVEETSVMHALREFSDVRFVDGNWFCHSPENPERDRLRNITRKMLSVAAPLDLSTAREGVWREFRYRGHRGLKTWSLIVPPRVVLRRYFEEHPEFEIDELDFLRPIEPLDYRAELSLNDSILVDVLRSSPTCVLDRSSLWGECARRSMNVNTFSLYLTYSPVIIHLGTDIWSLRGVHVDPAAVEAVRNSNALRQKERRVLDHGWTSSGQLWVATRLPSAHSKFTFGIPGPIRRFLAGRQFAASDDHGVGHGQIRINDEGTSYGFGAFVRQRGGDEGDILIAEFDLETSAAKRALVAMSSSTKSAQRRETTSMVAELKPAKLLRAVLPLRCQLGDTVACVPRNGRRQTDRKRRPPRCQGIALPRPHQLRARGTDRRLTSCPRHQRLSVHDPDERSLEGHARRLFGRSRTRGRCWRRFTRERYVYIVDAEHGGLPLRMPPSSNGSRKSITILNIRPGVFTDAVAPAHVAIHE